MKITLIKSTLGHAEGKELKVSNARAFYMMKAGDAEKDKEFMTLFISPEKKNVPAKKEKKKK